MCSRRINAVHEIVFEGSRPFGYFGWPTVAKLPDARWRRLRPDSAAVTSARSAGPCFGRAPTREEAGAARSS